MNLDVIPASRADLDELSAFQRRCFAYVKGGRSVAETQSSDYYRWKYFSPSGEALLAQIRIDGNLVAMNGAFPLELDRGGDSFRGWQSCDTATAPEGRGRGYFLTCLGALREAVSGSDAFFGFPNTNSAPGFKKFGWDVLARLRLYAGLLLPRKSCIAVPPVDKLFSHAAALNQQSGQVPKITVRRTNAYLNHRYASPLRPIYTCMDFGAGGYVVVRTVELARRRHTLIMDLQGPTPKTRRKLVAAAKTWGRSQKCFGIVAITNSRNVAHLIGSGMLPVPHNLSPRPIVLMADAERSGAQESWDCQIGDWDGF